MKRLTSTAFTTSPSETRVSSVFPECWTQDLHTIRSFRQTLIACGLHSTNKNSSSIFRRMEDRLNPKSLESVVNAAFQKDMGTYGTIHSRFVRVKNGEKSLHLVRVAGLHCSTKADYWRFLAFVEHRSQNVALVLTTKQLAGRLWRETDACSKPVLSHAWWWVTMDQWHRKTDQLLGESGGHLDTPLF